MRLILAPESATVIEPRYNGRDLKPGDKFLLSTREIVSLDFLAGVAVSSGFSHALLSDPKYGSNRIAFAQRVGAAGARQASQYLFSDGILSATFKEDPRYYVLGNSRSFGKRAIYAASRVVITRSDEGTSTTNLALLLGYAGSAALTQSYYPSPSRGAVPAARGYAYSLGGAALANEISEFFRFRGKGQSR